MAAGKPVAVIDVVLLVPVSGGIKRVTTLFVIEYAAVPVMVAVIPVRVIVNVPCWPLPNAGFSNSHRVFARLYRTRHSASAAGISPATRAAPPTFVIVCAVCESALNVGVVVAFAADARKPSIRPSGRLALTGE